MAGETYITVIGNLTADPDLRFIPNGTPVVNFTVASTPRQFDRSSGEWRDGEAMFLSCTVWRQYAENVSESLRKGMRVMVYGKLKARRYEDQQGNQRTSYEIDVEEVGPVLRYATANVQKSNATGNYSPGGGGQSYGSEQPQQSGGYGYGNTQSYGSAPSYGSNEPAQGGYQQNTDPAPSDSGQVWKEQDNQPPPF